LLNEGNIFILLQKREIEEGRKTTYHDRPQ